MQNIFDQVLMTAQSARDEIDKKPKYNRIHSLTDSSTDYKLGYCPANTFEESVTRELIWLSGSLRKASSLVGMSYGSIKSYAAGTLKPKEQVVNKIIAAVARLRKQ